MTSEVSGLPIEACAPSFCSLGRGNIPSLRLNVMPLLGHAGRPQKKQVSIRIVKVVCERGWRRK